MNRTSPDLLENADREIAVLQALCSPQIDESARKKLIELLRDYEWLDADRRELFRAVEALAARRSHEILPHLKAELTRRGFPEVSCEFLADGQEKGKAGSSIRVADALRDAQELRLSQAARP